MKRGISSTRKRNDERLYPHIPAPDTSDVDFILAMGDGKTDEIVFQVLLQSFGDEIVTTCTVGKKQTSAGWYVEDVDQVYSLLELMLN